MDMRKILWLIFFLTFIPNSAFRTPHTAHAAITHSYINYFSGTLYQPVTSASTTLTLTPSALSETPASGDLIRVTIFAQNTACRVPSCATARETIDIRRASGNTYTIVARAQENTTTPATWPAESAVQALFTAGQLTEMKTEISYNISESALSAHSTNTANPHSVTKAQVDLGNVEDYSLATMPVPSATQTALDLKADAAMLSSHTSSTANPHAVTKIQVGLGSVENYSLATMPVPSATQTALSLKQDSDATLTSLASLGSTTDRIAYTTGPDTWAESPIDAYGRGLINTGPITYNRNWSGLNVLWLGTSIPHQGVGVDGYPEITCALLGCTVDNSAWSGSHVNWDSTSADDCATNHGAYKGLSATVRELQKKIDNAVSGSVYYSADGVTTECAAAFSVANILSMSFEQRILGKTYDVVVLDHGHNDRLKADGTLNPVGITIASIATGTTTTVTTSTAHGLATNDDITIRATQIADLDYWTGEITVVDGTTFTVALNSFGFAGSYTTGGTVVKYDKSKFYDSYNLIISAIYYQNANAEIILTTPPTRWSYGDNDGSIDNARRMLYNLAAKWGLHIFDMSNALAINAANLTSWLPDTVHPTTTASREMIAEHFAQWVRAGLQAYPLATFGPKHLFFEAEQIIKANKVPAYYSDTQWAYKQVPIQTAAFGAYWQSGFEANDYAEWSGGETDTGSVMNTAPGPTGHGSYSLHYSDATTMDVAYVANTLSSNYTEVYVPFSIAVVNPVGVSTGGPHSAEFLRLMDTSNAAQVHVLFLTDAAGDINRIRVQYIDDAGALNTAFNYDVTLTANSWKTLTLYYKRATAGNADGIIRLYDGATLAGSVTTANNDARNGIGALRAGNITSNFAGAYEMYMDGFAVGMQDALTITPMQVISLETVTTDPANTTATIWSDNTGTAVIKDTSGNKFLFTASTGTPGDQYKVLRLDATGKVGIEYMPITLVTGTYTPTAGNTVNLDATPTMYTAQYVRVGDMVTVSGLYTADTTTTATATSFTMTLPIATNFTNKYQLAGTANAPLISQYASVHADITNDVAEVQFKSGGTSNQDSYYIYMYRIQ